MKTSWEPMAGPQPDSPPEIPEPPDETPPDAPPEVAPDEPDEVSPDAPEEVPDDDPEEVPPPGDALS